MRLKKKQEPNAALFLEEVLEPILLHLDTRTLLIPQRVCQCWHTVIKTSKPIQQALFLVPVEPTDVSLRERVRNPLLEEIIWPLVMHSEWVYTAKDALFRECASWRKMLFQQPPTSVIGIVELLTHQSRTRKDTHHEQILVKPQNDYLRMGAIYSGLEKGVLSSRDETWVLSDFPPEFRYFPEDFLEDARVPITDIAVSECDVVVFVYHAAVLIRGLHVKKSRLELWLDELLVDAHKYKPKRSGGVASRYYGRGYSKMGWSWY